MGPDLHISTLANGHYALHAIGGNMLNCVLGEFLTRPEAEYAMLRHALLSAPDAGLMLPGRGQGLG